MTGPVAFAIDGKDETAWGIDVGPGRRNTTAQGRLRRREADRVSRRSDPHDQPQAEPRRLEQRRQPEQQSGPVPPVGHQRGGRNCRSAAQRRPRDSGNPARATHAAADGTQSSATGGRPCRNGRRRNDRIEALGREHPEGASQLVLHEREKPRATHVLERGDFLKPARPWRRAFRRSLHPLPSGGEPVTADVREVAGRAGVADDGPSLVNRVWQAYFGTGLVAHQRGSRHRRASRRRIPSCSTGWPSSSWRAAGASSSCTG